MEEVRISEWPEPPGSHAWLPAYGFQHDIVEKDDYFGSNAENGSTHALYLETIVEETSDDLRSERSATATWLSDSDADSVIHVGGNAGSDSESEREWACPAKRRRRSPSNGSLSRSSSLAQFESLERSCAGRISPSLSPDSLESPPASPPPARPAARAHLSAENLSEDSGYSERARPPPPPARHHHRQPEIARVPAGSTPCLNAAACSPSAERRPSRTVRATSLPADLDVCVEPHRQPAQTTHRARFRQSFEVSECLTVSVADLTALDYRGGPRRPRQPPPPPPRVPPHPPPVTAPPPAPAREPSASSDSTTESERAFANEMETTARRLDETARRALQDTGDYDRELSVLTARRLRDSWGAWDDVLHELRSRIELPSPSPSPSPPRTPSPDPVREPPFTSTPLRSGDARVRSTPELRSRTTPHRETPDELRASLQLVAPPLPAPAARSVSAGSRGVTFSPVVAEVSWREVSASSSSAPSESASDDVCDAEVEEVRDGEHEPRAQASSRTERAPAMTEAAARAPRSRIAGFLSRFANFRFSGRKEKKSRSAGATARPSVTTNGGAVGAADAGQTTRVSAVAPQYVRIPLKEEAAARAPAVAPGAVGGGGGVVHKPPPPPRARAPPAPGVLETDVDTQRTVLHARSLLALAPPDQRTPRPHKSMEFLLDKDNAQTVQPPENELQKNSDRVLSEHELRVQRSLQKLNVPEWYKNAPTPREGFLLRKRLSDASAAGRWTGLNSKTTSLGSLGGAPPPALPPQLSPHTTSFGRWSTSRLNSNQTSPCSSTRSSIRGASPLCSPSTRSSFSARQPYLGWRSQERLNSAPRTPHERLASSLLQQTAAAKASEEIQTSIKEVTSAIVHYVSGLEPANGELDRTPSPRSGHKCWLESSFVGTKPLESPQTPLGVTDALPPPHPRPPSSLRLDHRAAPDWHDSQRSINVSVGVTRPSPGSTTLEDVLDSLLGLPSQTARVPTPQASPRKATSPYYLIGNKSPRYEQLNSSGPSSISPASRAGWTPSETLSSSASPDRPGTYTVDTLAPMQESRRPRSAQSDHSRRRSEPFVRADTSLDRRTSLDVGATRPADLPLTAHDSKASLVSLNTENSADEMFIKCKYPKCSSRALPADAKRYYKTCHNCTTSYCSKECRRAHWEKHRKVCLHFRASALCRQIISAAKENADALYQISNIGYRGYLACGRGVVKVFFTSPEAAEKFTIHGHHYLSQPEFVKWTALQPNDMGVELYTEVVKLCKTYNPETRVILYVAVCIISEVPTKGAVKWERQLVSRCAKLRLSKAVTASIQEQNRRRSRRDCKETTDERETLILTSKICHTVEQDSAQKFRRLCFDNICQELASRGVELKTHFPEVFSRLVAYVDGTSDRFIPMTINPKNVTNGKYFICVIMPDSEVNCLTPVEGQVTTVDVGKDHEWEDKSEDLVSTPM